MPFSLCECDEPPPTHHQLATMSEMDSAPLLPVRPFTRQSLDGEAVERSLSERRAKADGEEAKSRWLFPDDMYGEGRRMPAFFDLSDGAPHWGTPLEDVDPFYLGRGMADAKAATFVVAQQVGNWTDQTYFSSLWKWFQLL